MDIIPTVEKSQQAQNFQESFKNLTMNMTLLPYIEWGGIPTTKHLNPSIEYIAN